MACRTNKGVLGIWPRRKAGRLRQQGKRIGDPSRRSRFSVRSTLLIFSSHHSSCSLLSFPIRSTRDTTLMSIRANSSWTSSIVPGQVLLFHPFFFNSSFTFASFCRFWNNAMIQGRVYTTQSLLWRCYYAVKTFARYADSTTQRHWNQMLGKMCPTTSCLEGTIWTVQKWRIVYKHIMKERFIISYPTG